MGFKLHDTYSTEASEPRLPEDIAYKAVVSGLVGYDDANTP